MCSRRMCTSCQGSWYNQILMGLGFLTWGQKAGERRLVNTRCKITWLCSKHCKETQFPHRTVRCCPYEAPEPAALCWARLEAHEHWKVRESGQGGHGQRTAVALSTTSAHAPQPASRACLPLFTSLPFDLWSSRAAPRALVTRKQRLQHSRETEGTCSQLRPTWSPWQQMSCSGEISHLHWVSVQRTLRTGHAHTVW